MCRIPDAAKVGGQKSWSSSLGDWIGDGYAKVGEKRDKYWTEREIRLGAMHARAGEERFRLDRANAKETL